MNWRKLLLIAIAAGGLAFVGAPRADAGVVVGFGFGGPVYPYPYPYAYGYPYPYYGACYPYWYGPGFYFYQGHRVFFSHPFRGARFGHRRFR